MKAMVATLTGCSASTLAVVRAEGTQWFDMGSVCNLIMLTPLCRTPESAQHFLDLLHKGPLPWGGADV